MLRQAMHATILFARASMPGRQATAVKIAADTSRSAFLAIEVGVRQGSLTFMLSAKVYFSPLSQVT